MICLLLMVNILMGPADNQAFMEAYKKARKLEQCSGLLKRFPKEFSSYECIWRASRRELRFEDAEVMLGKILARNPDDHRARFFLGKVMAERHLPQSKPLMQRGIQGMQAASDTEGCFWGNIGIHYDLRTEGRMDEAEKHLDAARQVATRAKDTLLLAEVRMYTAWLAFHRSQYDQAWILFKRLEHGVPKGIRRCFLADVFDGLAETASRQGRHHVALQYYQKELELIRRFVVPSWEAGILYSIAVVAAKVSIPRRYKPEELLWFDREALSVSIKARDRAGEGRARLLLGQNPALTAPKRLAHLEQAVKILTEVKDADATLRALRVLARARLEAQPGKPAEAFDLVNRAIESARAQDKPEEVARGWIARAGMRWQTEALEQAKTETRSALQAIERVRILQRDRQIGSRVFGRFAFAYRRFAGQLLDRDEYDPAFRIAERMRARALLSSLQVSEKAAGPTAARTLLRGQISGVQKRLVDPGLSRQERNSILGQLERLEIEWTAAQNQAGLPTPRIPRLSDLQMALADDQALLFFQLDAKKAREIPFRSLKADSTGGSWLLMVTRVDTRAFPLADREELEPRLQMLLGLIDRRDGSEAQSAALLYKELIGPATKHLEPIKRLVIVPDGVLHRLPFGVLRPRAEASPLAATHQLSVAPSGTLWLRWQKNVRRQALVPAVALADPKLPFSDAPSKHRAAGIFRDGLKLGRLPHARVEAHSLVDRLGGDSRVWEGAQASEHRFKKLPLGDFRVLHLATHAVVDERHPHRSAVVLAAGSQEEDGLLQAPEIAELDMRDMVVLLSTCSSARGEVIGGEGVFSLSRAFFQAGALAVVGNLWPLRDDEGAALVQQFTGRLADGESLGQALGQVKMEWIQKGKPAAAWAGLILQGDADFVPFPTKPRIWLWLAGLAGLFGLLGLIGLARRRLSI